ncbi:MAG: glycoside hydrolase family 32 protein [Lachnospiraceae bacterium]|nr:glycoside hydrolase family 32 protein [Lachnospiraceae bacterium]
MRRFAYHFEPHTGWMNDPNGLVFFQGKYHAFFQHFPYDRCWGPMHWGHAVSEDLIHWQELPVALTPNESYENAGGCFSGSAVVKDDRLYLIYTSVSREFGQAQSVAWSDDGIHFTKYEDNPVLLADVDAEIHEDFRDPKVFPYGDAYRMVTGGFHNGRGRVLQFASEDLLHWEYMGVLYESLEYHLPLECPDLFPLGDKWVLMYSRIGRPEYAVQFIVGSYDGETFTPESYQTPEAGPQFYAPQSFEAEDGRRLIMGWFYDWSKPPVTKGRSAGALTVPRELWLDEFGMLRSYPVREAWKLTRALRPCKEDQSTLPGIRIFADVDRVCVEEAAAGRRLEHFGNIQTVEVLEDVKGCEIYVNGGEVNFSVNL